jgi:hypothetical protein
MPLLLTLCPDTIAGHHGCILEINRRISDLKASQTQIEHLLSQCVLDINAHEHVLRDAGEELGRILIGAKNPFRDFIQNRVSWNLGTEVVQLRTKVDSLREQKRKLEEELTEIADELVRLRNKRSVHVELIGVLVCENPACIAFLMQLSLFEQQQQPYDDDSDDDH